MQKLFSELSKTFEKWINFPPSECKSFLLHFSSFTQNFFFFEKNCFMVFFLGKVLNSSTPQSLTINCFNGVRQNQSFEFIKIIEENLSLSSIELKSLKHYKLHSFSTMPNNLLSEARSESFRNDYFKLQTLGLLFQSHWNNQSICKSNVDINFPERKASRFVFPRNFFFDQSDSIKTNDFTFIV